MGQVSQLTPFLGMLMESLRPMEQTIKSAVGVSPWEMRMPTSPALPNYFNQADKGASAQYIEAFAHQMGLRTMRHDSRLASGLSSAAAEMVDQLQMGQDAFRQALLTIGAGRSFAHSAFGQSVNLRDVMGSPTTPEDLLGAFTSLGRMRGGALSIGERQQVLGHMLRSNAAVFKGFRNVGLLEGVVESDTGALSPAEGQRLDAESQEMLNQANALRGDLRKLDHALATWKSVLNTDLKGAMRAITDLFGSEAVSMFSRSGDDLQSMVSQLRHSAALTGLQPGSILSGAQTSTKLLAGFHGPQEAALVATTFAAVEASGMAGFRITTPQAQQMALEMASHAIASPYARTLAGGYLQFLQSDRGRELGLGAESRRVYREMVDAATGSDGFNMEVMNRVLEQMGVGRMSQTALERGADSDAGRWYLSQSQDAVEMISTSRLRHMRNEIMRADPRFQDLFRGDQAETPWEALMLSVPERGAFLSERGVSGEAFDFLMYGGAEQTIRDQLRRGEFAAMGPGATVQDAARLLSGRIQRDHRTLRREAAARSAFERDAQRYGSYLQAGIDMIRRNLEGGERASIKDIFSTITGVPDAGRSFFAKMGGSSQGEYQSFLEAMEHARGALRSAGLEDMDQTLIQFLFDELDTASSVGDSFRIERARYGISGLLGAGFDDQGRLDFSIAATGAAASTIKRWYDDRGDTEESRREGLLKAAMKIDPGRAEILRAQLKVDGKKQKRLTDMDFSLGDRTRSAVLATATWQMGQLPTEETVGRLQSVDGGYYDPDTGITHTQREYDTLRDRARYRSRLGELLDKGVTHETRGDIESLLSVSGGTDMLSKMMGAADASVGALSFDNILRSIIDQATEKVVKAIKGEQ